MYSVELLYWTGTPAPWQSVDTGSTRPHGHLYRLDKVGLGDVRVGID